MNLSQALHRFYRDMSLNELRLMNENTVYPNITYNSLLYLDLISYKENCTVSYLAEILHISKSAVTIKVNELIKQGFVIKTQSEEDRRFYYLSISPSVKDIYKHYDKCLSNAAKILEEGYSEGERSTFLHMLEDIYHAYWNDSE